MGLRRQVSQLSSKLLIQLPRKLPCWFAMSVTNFAKSVDGAVDRANDGAVDG